jgi:hypothetical protein
LKYQKLKISSAIPMPILLAKEILEDACSIYIGYIDYDTGYA